jgi:hypothetical protein
VIDLVTVEAMTPLENPLPSPTDPVFGVQGPGSRVQGSGFRVQGLGSRVQGSGFRVQGPGSRVQGSGSSLVTVEAMTPLENPLPSPTDPVPCSSSLLSLQFLAGP